MTHHRADTCTGGVLGFDVDVAVFFLLPSLVILSVCADFMNTIIYVFLLLKDTVMMVTALFCARALVLHRLPLHCKKNFVVGLTLGVHRWRVEI